MVHVDTDSRLFPPEGFGQFSGDRAADAPSGALARRGRELLQDINTTLAVYIRAQLIACLLIGTVCTIGFSLIGVRYALVLGIVSGLLEFIPLVGPLVVAVIATLIASVSSLKQALGVVAFLGVLRIVHDYIVYPRIIGHGMPLHPFAVIVAVLCGAALAGVPGIFLAIPTVAILSVGYRHWLEHTGSEVADGPAETTRIDRHRPRTTRGEP